MRLPTLRQQWERDGQTSFRSLADYVAPRETGVADYLGAFAVTAGHRHRGAGRRVRARPRRLQRDHGKALADRLAEALAEMLHKRARQEWGYGRDENLSHDDLIEEKYRGIRPASGYPTSPDHTEKRDLWRLLDAEAAAGIVLTESFAMYPGASVSGLYFSHPQARYFAVDMITRDQVESYAKRKGMTDPRGRALAGAQPRVRSRLISAAGSPIGPARSAPGGAVACGWDFGPVFAHPSGLTGLAAHGNTDALRWHLRASRLACSGRDGDGRVLRGRLLRRRRSVERLYAARAVRTSMR